MKKIIVMLTVLILNNSLCVFSQDESGPEYGDMVNISVPFDGVHRQSPSMSHCAWSPDGKWIAFVPHDSAIYIVESEGGKARIIYNKESDYIKDAYLYRIEKLAFSPDSQKIVFESCIIDTSYGGKFINEPFGNGLIATRIRYDISHIESINIYTGEYAMLVRGGFSPSWSRDGRYISYVKFDEKTWITKTPIEHNGSPAIYDTVTKETRYLTEYSIPDSTVLRGYYGYNLYTAPVISPDNKSVYLTMLVSGYENLAKIPFEGGAPEVLTSFINPDTRCNNLQFSPDSNWISFGTAYEILLYQLSTGKVYDFFTGRKFVERNYEDKNQSVRPLYMCWSPDGNSICYTLYNKAYYSIYTASFNPAKYPVLGTFVKSEKPDGFSILGNYPNPFNPSTTISFSIPEKGNVSVDIYNMACQKVKTLVNGTMSAGKHSVKWDASGYPTGAYFYKVKAGKYEKSMRMTLVK